MSLCVHAALKLIIVINVELLTVDTMTTARTYVKGYTLFCDEDKCDCCLELIRISTAVLLKVFQKKN
jgi:hypothetical protein